MIKIYTNDGPDHCRVSKQNQEGSFALDWRHKGGLEWVPLRQGATPPMIHKAQFIFWADENL